MEIYPTTADWTRSLVAALAKNHMLLENGKAKKFGARYRNDCRTNLTYNCHQLVHLPLCVKRWGPLRSISVFAFENYNGYIAKCVHGNKNFGLEIVNNIQITQGIQMLKNRIAERENNAVKLNKSKNYELLGSNITKIEFNVIERNLFLSNGYKIGSLSIYSRLKINNGIFTSELYKTTKTNSYTAQIDTNDSTTYGSIKFFFEHENDILIVIRRLIDQHIKIFHHSTARVTVKHIIPIAESNNLMLLSLKKYKIDIQTCKSW
ncbi:uncharacterized protein LOC141532954 [Cotesia typhae]|uniref:uncharacterized protein LOC141532954 n=1 Tax=Cotesia typhae TaxID=2053667 RepID=UPI003D68C3FE